MSFPHRLSIVVFLATFLRPSVIAGYSAETYGVIEDIQKTLIRHTMSKHGENQTSDLLILNNDIVGQIINILNCGSFPNSPNSHLNYSLNYDAKKLILFQECDRYFKTTQKPDLLQVGCKYKKWIFNAIDCQITTCPPLKAPLGGQISTNDNNYNTTVYFWCDRGFNINGTDKVICEENAVWNLPSPNCHVSHCRPLSSPRHGFVSSQEEIAVNKTVEFSCKGRYSIIGDAVLRCDIDGRWNTSAPVCKKMCIVPIKNQSEGVRLVPSFKYLSVGSLVYQSQRVIFSCKPGYTMLSGLSTCIEGFWRPSIHCRKTCSAVKVNNGTYILSKDFSTIEYSCQPGYQLVGQRKLLCTPNNTWDNEAPICTKMCTLSEENEVLSFRDKKTYESIPFGTQIINGTQVYFVCRHNISNTVTECFNGELRPDPCLLTRLHNRELEIYLNGNWCPICESSFDLCELFKLDYRYMDRSGVCNYCCDFDALTFRKSKKIILSPKRPARYCVACID